MIAYCQNDNRTAFDLADKTGQSRQNVCFYIEFLVKNKLIERIAATKEMKVRNQKYVYRALVKEMPPEFKIDEVVHTNGSRMQVASPHGRIINFDNLPHNTAKGIMGKRSAFIGNSLETMSF